MTALSKIVLGTVQFGLEYGINNQSGIPDQAKVNAMLERASKAGIGLLDTAQAYGNAEEKIGVYHAKGQKGFRCMTKVPHGVPSVQVRQSLEDSAEKLKAPLHGVLVHHIQAFNEEPELWEVLKQAQSDGLFQKIGFSVYHMHDVDMLVENQVDFQLIQFPFNVFDQRFKSTIASLQKRGVEVHTRSAFLQGLFFKVPDQLKAPFNRVAQKIEQLQQLANQQQIPLSHLLLGFCLQQVHIDAVVIGVDSLENLEENLEVEKHFDQIRSISAELDALQVNDEEIILPINWK